MKIALVTPEFVTGLNFDGGLANYTYKIAKALQGFGHEVVVFVSSDKNSETVLDNIPVRIVKAKGYDSKLYSNRFFYKFWNVLKKRINKTGFLKAWDVERELRYQSKNLNREVMTGSHNIDFDIIHYAHLAAVGLYRPGTKPCVARLSGSTILCYENGGYGESFAEIEMQEKLEMDALKKMDAVFGPSRQIAAVVKKKIDREIQIIESPYLKEQKQLDDSLYQNHLSGKKYLLFFGTIGVLKGVGTIAEILADFFEKHTDYFFVFVGKILKSPDPKKNMLEYLQHKAGEFKNRIIHFDRIPHERLYPLVSQAEFVVLPSRIDNFPNTCIEAMAHKKIVIGTRGNGFEQLITDGKNGFLINVDDSRELLNVINKIISLPKEEKIKMENEAAARTELLRPDFVVRQLIAFYENEIKKWKKAKGISG